MGYNIIEYLFQAMEELDMFFKDYEVRKAIVDVEIELNLINRPLSRDWEYLVSSKN